MGVVCRSQADIDSGKSLEQALLDEQAFFMSSPEYRPVADVNGTRYLARKCNRLLTQHIRRVLPQLKTAISSQIRTLEAELVRIGDSAPPEDSTQVRTAPGLWVRLSTHNYLFARSVATS